MHNLDLYAKVEHLLGIDDATEALHNLYASELEAYKPKTLLDVGCGRGLFMKKMIQEGVSCIGSDLSQVMVEHCKSEALEAHCCDIDKIEGKFDAIVSIFDVLNFFSHDELMIFLEEVAKRLNDDGVFMADINTRYGFSDVADGSMVSENEDEFLSVDAIFENDLLETTLTLFERSEGDCYRRYQEKIVQYFHPLKSFQKLNSLKLVDKQTFALYESGDKTLLIFKKR